MPQTLSYTQGGSTLLSTAYTYDSRGNIATMTVDGVTWSYTYDSLNQLTGVTTSDNSFTASYSYDNGGNITSKTVNGVTTTYGYNDPNWKDKLTRYGNEGVSSDRIGNIWQIGTYQMSYVGRQLIEVYTAENNTINFYYNADGIRVKKVNEDIGTTNYFVDGSTILAEQTGTDVIWYIYDSNGEIVGFTYNEVPYYYLKNQQGDVYKIVEENGTLAGSYTYDPWGKVLTCTGTIAEINPIRYRSYYYDTETGYYYLQSRYYDPNVGRFLNADGLVSTGQGILGHNMFVDCCSACFGNSNSPQKQAIGAIPSQSSDTFSELMVQLPNGNELQISPQQVGKDIDAAISIGNIFHSSSGLQITFRDVTQEVNRALALYVQLGQQISRIANASPIYEHCRYGTFGLLVYHGSTWDIKRKGPWESTIGTPFPGYGALITYRGMLMTPEYLGNYTYGVLGASFGIPLQTLIDGSAFAAFVGGSLNSTAGVSNELEDWKYVMWGYMGYYLQ